MKLREVADNAEVIERVCKSRELEGDVAYKVHKFYRKYKGVIEDLSAFEKATMTEIGIEANAMGSLVYPGQDIKKFKEYLEKRNEFLDSEEITLEVPKFAFDKLKPAKLSGKDIEDLMEFGLIEDDDPPEEPEAKEEVEEKVTEVEAEEAPPEIEEAV